MGSYLESMPTITNGQAVGEGEEGPQKKGMDAQILRGPDKEAFSWQNKTTKQLDK